LVNYLTRAFLLCNASFFSNAVNAAIYLNAFTFVRLVYFII